jgi:uncharacterized membrane protein
MAIHRKHPLVRTFIRGLALILPLALTLGLLLWVWNQISDRLLEHVSAGVTRAVAWMHLDPLSDTTTFVVSVGVVLLCILLTGLWFSGFIGRRLFRTFEDGLGKVPLVKAIYPHIKQITEFIFGEGKQIEFKGVVAIEYPRKGLYSMGFLTGSSSKNLNAAADDELVSIFIPSSPMPVTGYTIFVPAKQIVDLPLTVDEALRTIISGGLLLPESEQAKLSAETIRRLAENSTRTAVPKPEPDPTPES